MSENIKQAIKDIQNGKPIIIADDHDREGECDLVIATEKATRENIVFLMNFGKGLMCVPCSGDILDKLGLPPMIENNEDPFGTGFAISADAIGTKTGMSVDDRLKTLAVFVDDDACESDLTRPGHLFGLRAKNGLLAKRDGHTESSLEMVKLAGFKLSSVIVEVINSDGSMTSGSQIPEYAKKHGLTLVHSSDLKEYIYGS